MAEVKVQVPHGMAWCTGGERVVSSSGATVEELWQNLRGEQPELMGRLSGDDGKPIQWLRLCVDGRHVANDAQDSSIEGAQIVTLTVIEGAPTAAPMGSRAPF
jgi:hypothetical protein